MLKSSKVHKSSIKSSMRFSDPLNIHNREGVVPSGTMTGHQVPGFPQMARRFPDLMVPWRAPWSDGREHYEKSMGNGNKVVPPQL